MRLLFSISFALSESAYPKLRYCAIFMVRTYRPRTLLGPKPSGFLQYWRFAWSIQRSWTYGTSRRSRMGKKVSGRVLSTLAVRQVVHVVIFLRSRPVMNSSPARDLPHVSHTCFGYFFLFFVVAIFLLPIARMIFQSYFTNRAKCG